MSFRNDIRPSTEDSASKPEHYEDPMRAIRKLHAAHATNVSSPQRWVERITRRAGTPRFVGLLTLLVVLWITLNLSLSALGHPPLDRAPFPWLQGAVALAALYIAVLILSTQQRDDQLAALRDQLALELAILSEQKSAKIIALLEELRRDSPTLENRHDSHANDLSKPADTSAVLDALKDRQRQQASRGS